VALARDGAARAQAAECGERFAAAHRGAAKRTADAVLALLVR
jgi:hypothetical protein